MQRIIVFSKAYHPPLLIPPKTALPLSSIERYIQRKSFLYITTSTTATVFSGHYIFIYIHKKNDNHKNLNVDFLHSSLFHSYMYTCSWTTPRNIV